MTDLNPRKAPVQRRSAATVEALHTAAIQVLVREGLARCTTTRVAERAGASVGSLYQYYPNRDALLSAVLEEHLTRVADAVAGACIAARGCPIGEMAGTLVRALLSAKLADREESRALYSVAGERGGPMLVRAAHDRMIADVACLLKTAPDRRVRQPEVVASVLLNALFGPITSVLKDQTPARLEAHLEAELIRVASSYLRAAPTG
ncbi:TetR/AcrR family transcriptional regulator [Primorskyibacter flagellatus]|nr:TetR/AcrR family transcriptional regulator [Primorskyibacter flagellatus]